MIIQYNIDKNYQLILCFLFVFQKFFTKLQHFFAKSIVKPKKLTNFAVAFEKEQAKTLKKVHKS